MKKSLLYVIVGLFPIFTEAQSLDSLFKNRLTFGNKMNRKSLNKTKKFFKKHTDLDIIHKKKDLKLDGIPRVIINQANLNFVTGSLDVNTYVKKDGVIVRVGSTAPYFWIYLVKSDTLIMTYNLDSGGWDPGIEIIKKQPFRGRQIINVYNTKKNYPYFTFVTTMKEELHHVDYFKCSKDSVLTAGKFWRLRTDNPLTHLENISLSKLRAVAYILSRDMTNLKWKPSIREKNCGKKLELYQVIYYPIR